MLPRAPRDTVRASGRGWGSTTKERTLSTSLSTKRRGKKEKRKKTVRVEDEEEEERREEAVISVGRAGCIRSNIMQAHTGSLLECVRSLGSCAPTIVVTARPFRGALYGVHAEHKAPGTRERFCSSGFSLRTCVGLRFSRAARARACPPYLRTGASAQMYMCICVYIRLTLPA